MCLKLCQYLMVFKGQMNTTSIGNASLRTSTVITMLKQNYERLNLQETYPKIYIF